MSSPVLSELAGVRVGRTRYQRLHVVTKLLVPLSISAALACARGLAATASLLAISAALNLVAGIPLRALKKYVAVVASITVFIALSFSLFTYVPGRVTLLELTILRVEAERGCVEWKLMVSDRSLEYMALFSMRIVTMILTATLLLGSVSDREVVWGLRGLGAPYALCMFVALLFRGISFFVSDFVTVRDAMQVRGVEIERGSLRERFSAYSRALVPLIMLMVRRSYEMSLALEARGLRLTSRFSGRYHAARAARLDFAVVAASLALPVLLCCGTSLGVVP